MSSYEDYTRVARHYDRTRQAVGVEIVLGCLARGPSPLHEAVVLDAGCGTGSYSRAVLGHVGRVEAVDGSPDMLRVAWEKMAAEHDAGLVGFHEGDITAPPFEDATFDGAMVNQVLHHLGDDPDDGFPAHRAVLAQMGRVLKPGGVLVVNTSSQQQLRHGYWYYDLIPGAAAAVRSRFAPLGALVHLLGEVGMDYSGRFAALDAVIQGEAYFDARGPLREEWRDGDSTWSLLSPPALERALTRVGELDERGRLEGYLHHHDASRPDFGQVTFLLAFRPPRPG
ncbi:MAG: class I SAM-dependent methyltransferase [Actinobacteria bacterium]|nr:class I SAM-dependent methyltransferase [Actinomycetota bacterium]